MNASLRAGALGIVCLVGGGCASADTDTRDAGGVVDFGGDGCVDPRAPDASLEPTPDAGVPTPFSIPESCADCALEGVSAGGFYVFYGTTCVNVASGEVSCFGDAMGRDADFVLLPPSQVAIAEPLHSVVVGGMHVCGVTSDARAVCWGSNFYGELGRGLRSFGLLDAFEGPQHLDIPDRVASVAPGVAHTCVLTETGAVYCAGLGISDVQLHPPLNGPLVNASCETADAKIGLHGIDGLPEVATLASGQRHACALTSGGDVWCWGNNESGQLGAPGITDVPVQVDIHDATHIAASGHTTCVVRNNGEVWCWGADIADGRAAESRLFDAVVSEEIPGDAQPTRVEGLSDIVYADIGNEHACALGRAGDVLCWGRNTAGQLGDGSTIDHAAPTSVLSSVTSLAVGRMHTCAIQNREALFCWGDHEAGQLGLEVAPSTCVSEGFNSHEYPCALAPTRVPAFDAP